MGSRPGARCLSSGLSACLGAQRSRSRLARVAPPRDCLPCFDCVREGGIPPWLQNFHVSIASKLVCLPAHSPQKLSSSGQHFREILHKTGQENRQGASFQLNSTFAKSCTGQE